MAKKEQCVDCNKFETDACPYRNAIKFDNNDCNYYASEHNIYNNNSGYKKYPNQNTYHKKNSNDYQTNRNNIKGWLLIFFIISVLAALSNIIIPLIDLSYTLSIYKSEKIFWCIYIYDILTFGFLSYCIFTFIYPKKNAIYNIYDYLSLIILGSIFKALGSYFWEDAIGDFIFAIIWAIIWIIYFLKSNYIASLIPKDIRERDKRLDFLTIIFMIPIIISVQDIATITANNFYSHETTSKKLTGKTYSNNYITFTAPNGYIVSSDYEDDIEIFSIENDYNYIITFSDYELASYSLDELWDYNISEEFTTYNANISKWQPLKIKNQECYYKIASIEENEDTLYSYFYVIHKNRNKVYPHFLQ